MDTALLIEIFGYIGSALVVISMLMSSIVKLRIVNTVGSIVSGAYALIVGAFPLVLMNGCLIAINVVNLYKLLNTKRSYDLVEGTTEDALVDYFLKHYSDDIKKHFPGFDVNAARGKKAYIALCEGKPAGVIVGEKSDGTFRILIDYSTPEYRDCSVASFIYSQFTIKNIKEVIYAQELVEVHREYMIKMGFEKVNDEYIKKLK